MDLNSSDKKNYPQPPPDRRLNRKSSQPGVSTVFNKDNFNKKISNTALNYKENVISNNFSFTNIGRISDKNSSQNILHDINKFYTTTQDQKLNANSLNSNYEENTQSNSFNIIKIKNIEESRKYINNYQILNDKKMFLNNLSSSISIDYLNIVLFGPSGSGKSSLIRTLFKSIYAYEKLPKNISDKLIIKDSFENEGTLCFLRMTLKENKMLNDSIGSDSTSIDNINNNSTNNIVKNYTKTKTSNSTSGIKLCDTRGHLLMNKEEKEQFRLIVEGKVKDNVIVEQTKTRNPFLLWEFWKSNEEIFPNDILIKNKSNRNNAISYLSNIPHGILLVFDGSLDDIIDPNEVEFYRDLVSLMYNKGYKDVHVILTRVDILEEMVYRNNSHKNKEEINNIILSFKDAQIEKVIDCLGVKRSCVYFVENYLKEDDKSNIDIDYHQLKVLTDVINSSEQFLINYLNKNSGCFGCF